MLISLSGLVRPGVEECPPLPSRTTSISTIPFSAIPITAIGLTTPGNTPCIIAPPSSKTSSGYTSLFFKISTIPGAPAPIVSSSCPKARYISRAGLKPLISIASTASQIPQRVPLVSSVPRPQITPSSITPSKGGYFHCSLKAGTTS